MADRVITWSCGGGLQSVAIAVLIRKGILPTPSLAGIVDTGWERRTTWEYLQNHLNPYLAPTGLQIEVIPNSYPLGLYSRTGLPLMPVYTKEGRLPGYCSGEWKRTSFSRWLRNKGVKSCVTWIGFSLDELRRVPKVDRVQWQSLEFPLIDKMLNRTMCLAAVRAAGLPAPPKSRCYMCPHQSAAEWADVLADPVDRAQAIAVDAEVRANDPEGSGLFLHRARVPLEMVGSRPVDEVPMAGCEGGVCFI